MFSAVVKVVFRFSVFCPLRCWRESGGHPSQPNFYIPALLEHAWSFAVQDEAKLAQPMHHLLLIRYTLNPWCPCLKLSWQAAPFPGWWRTRWVSKAELSPSTENTQIREEASLQWVVWKKGLWHVCSPACKESGLQGALKKVIEKES